MFLREVSKVLAFLAACRVLRLKSARKFVVSELERAVAGSAVLNTDCRLLKTATRWI